MRRESQMSKPTFELALEKLDNFIQEKCGGKEYYFGCWSADDLNFGHTKIPTNIILEKGKNWFALKNGANITEGLIFPKEADHDPELVVFRGYLADESLHSYSDPQRVKEYWSGELVKKHNGIFSAVTITEGGKKLNIITDLFGIGPIYTRKIDNLIFFSTTPGLLSFEHDEPDMAAWYMRLAIGSVPGDKSLSKSIALSECASVTTYTADGSTAKKWFDLDLFPKGEKPVNEETLEQSEKYFSKAIKRCLELKNGHNILPLSGGFDSRRIFAHLEKNKISFETITVQMPTKSGEDADAIIASQIAKDHNIKNTVLQYPSDHQWHKNTVKRILALDGLTDSHTWSGSFFQAIEHHKCCIFDGIAGDTFVCDGWRYENYDKDIMADNFPKALNPNAFPTTEEVLTELTNMHNSQPTGPNRGLFSFVAWHTRRNTSLWSQQQALPGQLIVCPYFDLDYIETMFKYVLKEGDFYRTQRGIFEKYWKKLSSYSNTRSMSDDFESLEERADENKDRSLKKLIKETRGSKVQKFYLSDLLSLIGNIAMFASRYSRLVRDRTYWWTSQITEVTFWWQNRPSFIKMNKKTN